MAQPRKAAPPCHIFYTMAILFKTEALNKDFAIICEDDKTVILPDGWEGKLSEIPTADQLHGMVDRKCAYIQRKITVAATNNKALKNEEK